MATITGKFVSGSPAIELSVEGTLMTALIDTGFNGFLMLPAEEINKMNLSVLEIAEYTTASGEQVVTFAFEATVDWFGKKRMVSVIPGPKSICLVGTALLYDCRLVIEPMRGLVTVSESVP